MLETANPAAESTEWIEYVAENASLGGIKGCDFLIHA